MIIPIPEDLIPAGQEELWRVLQNRLQALEQQATAASPAASPAASRAASRAGSLITGTHSQRLSYAAAAQPLGAMFYETDRTVFYIVVQVGAKRAWKWMSGKMSGLLLPATPPASPITSPYLPVDLTGDDIGFRYFAADVRRTYRWGGAGSPTGWDLAWEDGEEMSGFIAWHISNPGAGWFKCDGSTVTRANQYGQVYQMAMPNLIGGYLKAGNGYTATVQAAVNPAISGETAPEASHTHIAGSLAASSNVNFWNTNVAGGTIPLPQWNHAHSIAGSTGAGTPHLHGAGTLAATGGEPPRIELVPYFRT